MHPLTSIIVLCGVTVASCALLSGEPAGSGTVWPKVAHCAADAGGDAIADVSAALLEGEGATIGDGATAKLEQLALKYTTEAVACMVNSLIRDWTAPGASPVAERLDAADRGRDFLAKKGVTRIE